MISSLTYFFVLDFPPINHGYIIFNGNPAVLVSVGPMGCTDGELQETTIILISFKTKRYKILVGKAGLEPAKA